MLKPLDSGNRLIIIEPMCLQKCSYDIWVDDELQERKVLRDPKTQILNYIVPSDFDGALKVKIKVKSGLMVISTNDAYGLYPAGYDFSPEGICAEGHVAVKQHGRVEWIQNPSIPLENGNIRLESGDELEYFHLMPNAPDWLRLFFHFEKQRQEFIGKQFLNAASAEKCIIVPESNHYVRDYTVDKETRTKNLTDKLGI